MTCDNPLLPLKENDATWDTTRALLTALHLYIPHVTISKNKQPFEQPVSIHMVHHVDVFNTPFFFKESDIKLPAIAVGVPDLSENHDYATRSGTEFIDKTSATGYRIDPPVSLDHKYNIKLISDNTIILQSLMTKFSLAVKNKMASLNVHDRQNDILSEYDLDVLTWPQGSFANPNNDGIYEARAQLVIRGVEIEAGKVESFPLVTSMCIVGVGFDEKAEAYVNDNNEVIITVIQDPKEES